MAWLSLSAGSVHIIVLTAGLMIAGLLAAITWRYRGRSAAMPGAPAVETSAEAGEDAAPRRELRAQVAFLAGVLNKLPPGDSSRLTEAILNGDDLRDFPFSRFRALVSEFDAAADSAAAAVESNMTWLGEIIREVRSKRSGLHYDWKNFPRVRYNEMLRTTRRPLQELAHRFAEPASGPPTD